MELGWQALAQALLVLVELKGPNQVEYQASYCPILSQKYPKMPIAVTSISVPTKYIISIITFTIYGKKEISLTHLRLKISPPSSS